MDTIVKKINLVGIYFIFATLDLYILNELSYHEFILARCGRY